MLRNFSRQEWWKNVRKMNLFRPCKISLSQIKILRHGAELDVVRAENVAKLPQRLLGSHVGTCIPRAVVPGKKELELLSRLPPFAFAENPTGLGALNVA